MAGAVAGARVCRDQLVVKSMAISVRAPTTMKARDHDQVIITYCNAREA
jgi:hypothetical protein